jgi:predicted nucleic acid-binding Zn ribbon protein
MPAARLAATSARRSASEGSPTLGLKGCPRMHDRHCERCGTAFLPWPRGGHPQRFCSSSCRLLAKRARGRQRREPRPQTTCSICGTMFAPNRATALYCSFNCKERAWRQRRRANPQAQGAG